MRSKLVQATVWASGDPLNLSPRPPVPKTALDFHNPSDTITLFHNTSNSMAPTYAPPVLTARHHIPWAPRNWHQRTRRCERAPNGVPRLAATTALTITTLLAHAVGLGTIPTTTILMASAAYAALPIAAGILQATHYALWLATNITLGLLLYTATGLIAIGTASVVVALTITTRIAMWLWRRVHRAAVRITLHTCVGLYIAKIIASQALSNILKPKPNRRAHCSTRSTLLTVVAFGALLTMVTATVPRNGANLANICGTLPAHGFDGDDMTGPTLVDGVIAIANGIWRLQQYNAGGVHIAHSNERPNATAKLEELVDDALGHGDRPRASIFSIAEVGPQNQLEIEQMQHYLHTRGYEAEISPAAPGDAGGGILVAWDASIPTIKGAKIIVAGRAIRKTMQGPDGNRLHIVAVYGHGGNQKANKDTDTPYRSRADRQKELLEKVEPWVIANDREQTYVAGDLNLVSSGNLYSVDKEKTARWANERKVLDDFKRNTGLIDLVMTRPKLSKLSVSPPTRFGKNSATTIDYALGTAGVAKGVQRAGVNQTCNVSDHSPISVDVAINGMTSEWSETKWANVARTRISDTVWKLRHLSKATVSKWLRTAANKSKWDQAFETTKDEAPRNADGSIDKDAYSEKLTNTLLELLLPLAPKRPVPRAAYKTQATRATPAKLQNINNLIARWRREGATPLLIVIANKTQLSDGNGAYDDAWIGTLTDKARDLRSQRAAAKKKTKQHCSKQKWKDRAEEQAKQGEEIENLPALIDKVSDKSCIDTTWHLFTSILPDGTTKRWVELTRNPTIVMTAVRDHMRKWLNRGETKPCPMTHAQLRAHDLTPLTAEQRRHFAKKPITQWLAGEQTWSGIAAKPLTVAEKHFLRAKGVGKLSKKAQGQSAIHFDWYMLTDASADAMFTLLDECLLTATVPANWRHSVVKLVSKIQGAPVTLQNARPISLMETAAKAYETIVYRRISPRIHSSRCLSNLQHATAVGGTVERPLAQLRLAFEEARAHGLPVHMLYVDTEKAFDSPPMWVIYLACQRLHMPADVVNLLLATVHTRTASVRTAYGTTETFEVLHGVPQGAVLSPLLWAIVYDILLTELEALPHHMLSVAGVTVPPEVFVDDIGIPSGSLRSMETLASVTIKTLHSLNIGCNLLKSTYTTNDPTKPKLRVDGVEIPFLSPTVAVRQLGVWLTLDLNPSETIRRLRISVGRTLTCIAREKPRFWLKKYITNTVIAGKVRFAGGSTAHPDLYLATEAFDSAICDIMHEHVSSSTRPRQCHTHSTLGLGIVNTTRIAVKAMLVNTIRFATEPGYTVVHKLAKAQEQRLSLAAQTPGSVWADIGAATATERTHHAILAALHHVKKIGLPLHLACQWHLDAPSPAGLARDTPLYAIFPTAARYRAFLHQFGEAKTNATHTLQHDHTAAANRIPQQPKWLSAFVPYGDVLPSQLDLLHHWGAIPWSAPLGWYNTLRGAIGETQATARPIRQLPPAPVHPPPRPLALLSDATRAARAQEWCAQHALDEDTTVAQFCTRCTGTYAQIHTDGSAKGATAAGAASIYCAGVQQNSSYRVETGSKHILDGPASSSVAEISILSKALEKLPSGLHVIELLADPLGQFSTLVQLIGAGGEWLNHHALVSKAGRPYWNSVSTQITRLSQAGATILPVWVRSHQRRKAPVFAINNTVDSNASIAAEIDEIDAPYIHRTDLAVALATTEGCPVVGPDATFDLAASKLDLEQWAGTTVAGNGPSGAFARTLLAADKLRVGTWTFAEKWGTAAMAVTVQRLRTAAWFTPDRRQRIHPPVDGAGAGAGPANAPCDHCAQPGPIKHEHMLQCPAAALRAQRLASLVTWSRALLRVVPDLWNRANRALSSDKMRTLVNAVDNGRNLLTFGAQGARHVALYPSSYCDSPTEAVTAERFQYLAQNVRPGLDKFEAIRATLQWGATHAEVLAKNGWTAPRDLITAMKRMWNVRGELCSAALNAHPDLEHHVSGCPTDTAFRNTLFDIFSDETRALVRAPENDGACWEVNPPYNEGLTLHSSSIMRDTLLWAADEVQWATQNNRAVSFVYIVPYETGQPAHRTIAKINAQLGDHTARVIAIIPKGAMDFEHGLAWRSPQFGTLVARANGPSLIRDSADINSLQSAAKSPVPRGTNFETGIIDFSSQLARASDGVRFSSANADVLLEWAEIRLKPSLPIELSALWPADSLATWVFRSANWTLAAHSFPFTDTFAAATTAPPAQAGSALDDILSTPAAWWQTLLIPSSFQHLPAHLGVSSRCWKSAALHGLVSHWLTVEKACRAEDTRSPERIAQDAAKRAVRHDRATASILRALGPTVLASDLAPPLPPTPPDLWSGAPP